jgi:hypothetical protein
MEAQSKVNRRVKRMNLNSSAGDYIYLWSNKEIIQGRPATSKRNRSNDLD